VGALDEKTVMDYIESQKWDQTTKDSKSQRPASLEPALSRGRFKRLQPRADFQAKSESIAF